MFGFLQTLFSPHKCKGILRERS